MNPVGALYIAQAIEDERRRFVEQRRRSRPSRSLAPDVTPMPGRAGLGSILRFRRTQAASPQG